MSQTSERVSERGFVYSRRTSKFGTCVAETSSGEVEDASAERQGLRQRLFALAWPIIGLNVLQVLALAVDTAMCGRLDQAEQALSALGFATQVVFLSMVAMIGVMAMIAMVAIKSLSSEGRSLPSPHGRGGVFHIIMLLALHSAVGPT